MGLGFQKHTGTEHNYRFIVIFMNSKKSLPTDIVTLFQ